MNFQLPALALFTRSLCALVFSFALLGSIPVSDCRAGEFHNSLSLQGFTGILNTPNAEVTAEGRLYALFSDQEEIQWRNRTPRQENYLFSVGLFSIAELGGRVTEAPGKARDLSANFKVKVPFIPQGYYLPSIAFGMQDVGGGIKKLQTMYAVASKEIWRLRLSLGYGAGPDRMDGVFGGGEFRAFDWLYLLGDYDTSETNAGIRIVTPEFYGIPVNLSVTAKTSLNHRPGSVFEFGFGLQFPLGRDYHNSKPAEERVRVTHRSPAEQYGVIAEREIAAVEEGETVPEPAREGNVSVAALQRMKKALVEEGFRNVAVGSKDLLLVVVYENSRYNHNELDGLGVVAGITAAYAPPAMERIRIVIKKKDIRILQLSMPLDSLRAFLRNADRLEELNGTLEIRAAVQDDDGVRYVGGDGNPSRLTAELMVYPGLKTFIATEVGTFDYLLSVKPDLIVNTWKGGVINARWDIPVSWSENFDDGKAFRSFRRDSNLDRLMLQQAVRIAPPVMAILGAGMIEEETYGTLNEVMWTPGDGTHRFRAKVGYADDRDRHSRDGIYLASYRYYCEPLETWLEGAGGRFLRHDTGFTVELKRFFGDTAFSVFYKNTGAEGRKNVQVGGVQFSFPLTPRRDMKPYPVQLRGSDEWSYAQETVIVSPGQANAVGSSMGVDPRLSFNLERVFYNRDRLTEAYIRKHLLRLRDAHLRYGER